MKIPQQALDYLQIHQVMAVGTSSFTGMPHVSTTIYANDTDSVYFPTAHDEITRRNVADNSWASFTVSTLTSDLRRARALWGQCHCEPLDAGLRDVIVALFVEKLPTLAPEALTDLQRLTPLELHFVDYDYPAGVDGPVSSTIVYETTITQQPPSISTTLDRLTFDPGQVIVHQGERSQRFFIVIDGEVEVRKDADVRDITVTRHGPGQLFGEISAINGTPHAATYTALARTTVLVVDRSSFHNFATQSAAAHLGQRVSSACTSIERDLPT